MIHLLTETRLHPEFGLSRAELPPLVQGILEVLGLDEASLTLRLVDDAEIARLNQEFLGCFGPTNVLSFPAAAQDEEFGAEDASGMAEADAETADAESGEFDPDDEEDSGDAYLGEIALSVDTLAREARLYGQDPHEHLVRLLGHAVLHLAGLDHGPEMEAMTEAVLDALA